MTGFLERHPSASLVGLIVAILIVAGVIGSELDLFPHRQLVEAPPPGQVYYLDLTTGATFAGPPSDIYPVPAPSGPGSDGRESGVRAYVYSCADCAEENSRLVGYLESKTKNQNGSKSYVATRDHPAWYLEDSVEGHEIVESARQLCSGKPVNECTPPAP